VSTLHLSTTGKRQKDKHKKDKKIQNKTGPATHIKLTHKPTNTHACYSHVICTLIGKEGETKLRKKKETIELTEIEIASQSFFYAGNLHLGQNVKIACEGISFNCPTTLRNFAKVNAFF